LITDIKLGSKMNGWEVARHARQTYPGIAVVYMSGDSAADWTAEGVPNSVMLQKPFATAQVTTAISTLSTLWTFLPVSRCPVVDADPRFQQSRMCWVLKPRGSRS
jgi:CheY-like chemotaxis protein